MNIERAKQIAGDLFGGLCLLAFLAGVYSLVLVLETPQATRTDCWAEPNPETNRWEEVCVERAIID